jgi:hypothetical protein
MGGARQPDQPGRRARPITIQKLYIRRIRYVYLEFFEEHVSTLIEELRSVQSQSSSALVLHSLAKYNELVAPVAQSIKYIMDGGRVPGIIS